MTILIKGAGDLGSAVAVALHKMGHRIVLTELPVPICIRRKVAFSPAIYEGLANVEGVTGERAADGTAMSAIWARDRVAVLVDPKGEIGIGVPPDVVVDAILAKENRGTKKTDAPLVVALGPGFTAGQDCHAVVETARGHDLGRVIYSGSARPNSGIPGAIAGETERRMLRAPVAGVFTPRMDIGNKVTAGDTVGTVDGQPVVSRLSGVVRGLLQPGVSIWRGRKVGDVDPRGDVRYCYTISDKARLVAAGVVSAIYTKPKWKVSSVGLQKTNGKLQ